MIATFALLLCSGAFAKEVSFTDAATGQPLAGVVVSSPAADAAPPANAEMAQRRSAFDPHYLVINRGSNVDFPNYDAVKHHVYSFSKARVFDLELFSGRPQAPVNFDQPGIVEVGCNIHDNMQGFIVVLDGRQSLLSDSDGQVTLPDSWLQSESIQYWHPQLQQNDHLHQAQLPADETNVAIGVDLKAPVESTSRLDALQQKFRNLR